FCLSDHVFYIIFAFFSLLLFLLPPVFTLFPYTTLFRSVEQIVRACEPLKARETVVVVGHQAEQVAAVVAPRGARQPLRPVPPGRSEEHTSELQSRVDLVCRLLLEKTKDEIFCNNVYLLF